ncbi:major capsid protein [Capybara microvirus Cap1_SP_222]|nr:major capsid protein [Capybara microvirus Cap1_SP_222]
MNIWSLFNSVPAPKLKHNKFNLSHDVKQTQEFGKLVPNLLLFGVPGDKFKISTETMCRLAPLISPVMDNIDYLQYYFKVPYRLVYGEDNYNKFFVEGESDYKPRISFTKDEANEFLKPGTLLDYLGYPTLQLNSNGQFIDATFADTIEFDASPILAFWLVWNEFFRDENLQLERVWSDTNTIYYLGVKSASDFYQENFLDLPNKCWRKDYFTSALPWTQKGPQALLPLSGYVDIGFVPGPGAKVAMSTSPSFAVPHPGDNILVGGTLTNTKLIAETENGDAEVTIDNSKNLVGTIGNTTATINDLRRMTALQRYFEAKARGGSRTAEWLLSIFGVRPSDLRLQRPEFLGMTKTPIIINSVDQTSQTTGVSPQGYQSGKGFGFGKSSMVKTYVDEHSFIIGISCIAPQAMYFQGCSRELLKKDVYDHFLPQFQGIGEQAVYDGELYYDFSRTDEQNKSTFGYQSRYSEYKFMPNTCHGDFKSTLAFYHLGRFFGSRPALNDQFLKINAQQGDLNRIFATELYDVQNQFHHFWLEHFHHVDANRPMKFYSLPSII